MVSWINHAGRMCSRPKRPVSVLRGQKEPLRGGFLGIYRSNRYYGQLGNLLTVLVLTITIGFRRSTQSQDLTTGMVCLAVLSHDSRLGVSGFARVLGLKCTSHNCHPACWTSYILSECPVVCFDSRITSRPRATGHDSRRHDCFTTSLFTTPRHHDCQ